MRLGVAASLVALLVIALVGVASIWQEQQSLSSRAELVDIDMGDSGSGLDFGLEIPKPTLRESELKKLEHYEKTRKKLLRVIRRLEARLDGQKRPEVEIRIATVGQKGVPGPAGAMGHRGPKGLQGPVGRRGNLGLPGPQGLPGPAGIQGPPGPPGQIGSRGAPGATGATGPRGPRGDDGPVGPRGPPGRVGPRGHTGKMGVPGDLGPRGDRGKRGAPGKPGKRGLPPAIPGIVKGKVVNVMNGDTLTGVRVRLLQDNTVVQNLVVSPTGHFRDRIAPGEYDLVGESPGFIRFKRTITVKAHKQTFTRVFMSPVLPDGELRIVLSWGKKTSNLDLHLDTPSGCKVAWDNRICSSATQDAALDHDVTAGTGPETITLARMEPGTYKVWVHSSDVSHFRVSQAQVRIFYPSGEIKVFRLGSDGVLPTEDTWEVFTIDGTTGDLFGPVMEGTKWLTVPGMPATFTSLSTSQSGLNVWGASEGKVYRRSGITGENKMGTGWDVVPGVHAIGVAASDLGVWVWDEAGSIFARDGVTPSNGAGVSWLKVPPPPEALYSVSFDGANAVCTTTDGRIWWRAGITPAAAVGSSWFQVPGRMTFVSVYSNALWGIRHGKIFRRVHMDTAPPAGTGWEEVPGLAARVAVSNGAVWTVAENGLVFFRKGITPDDPEGDGWGELEHDLAIKTVSVGNGVIWGLDSSDSPVFRDGVAQTGK